MTDAKIFLVGNEQGKLTEMVETAYDTEAVLQTLLVDYPGLLPGDQINPDYPRRWLLVQAEMGVPGGENESNRWSLDHLFLDQDGIPTFVECKRATDTRIRREVVAQMLDYAANGVEYWTMDRLRLAAAETASLRNLSLDEVIGELIDAEDELDIEEYWDRVAANLKEGRVRLLFVADKIPKELRRLVEFMNEKMKDVEVLAIEVKQFLGQGQQKVLVPRVIGLTEAARASKSATSSSKTNRTDFMAKISTASAGFFEKAIDLAVEKGHTIYWGQKGFSFRARLSQANKMMTFAYGWPSGNFQVAFAYLPLPAEELQALRQELLTFGIFNEWGKKSLMADTATVDLSQLNEAFDFIMEKVDDITARY